jgi:hypothetical protein
MYLEAAIAGHLQLPLVDWIGWDAVTLLFDGDSFWATFSEFVGDLAHFNAAPKTVTARPPPSTLPEDELLERLQFFWDVRFTGCCWLASDSFHRWSVHGWNRWCGPPVAAPDRESHCYCAHAEIDPRGGRVSECWFAIADWSLFNVCVRLEHEAMPIVVDPDAVMVPSICSNTASRGPEMQHWRWCNGFSSSWYSLSADFQNKSRIAAVIIAMKWLWDAATCDVSESSMIYERSGKRCSRSSWHSAIVHHIQLDVVVELFSWCFEVEKQSKPDELEMGIEVYIPAIVVHSMPITAHQHIETVRELELKAHRSSISMLFSLFSVTKTIQFHLQFLWSQEWYTFWIPW